MRCFLSSSSTIIMRLVLLLLLLLILDDTHGFVPLGETAAAAAAFETSRGIHRIPGRNYMQISSATTTTIACIARQRICRERYHLLRATELLEPETASEQSESASSSSSSSCIQTSSPSLFDETWLEDDDDNNNNDCQQQQQLPPWLSRYNEVTTTEQQDTDELFAWLEFSLRQQEWHAADIQEISQELRHLLVLNDNNGSKKDDNNNNGSNTVAVVAGCIDFLRTYLHAFVEHESKSWFVTKAVLLAAIQHYVDCISVRKKGIHDLILRQSILIQQEPGRMLGGMRQPEKEVSSSSSSSDNSQRRSTCNRKERCHKDTSTAIVLANKHTHGASKSSSSSSSPRDDNKATLDEIHSIVNGAARIKRAEIMSQVFLASANMSDTKTAQGIRSLLLAVTEDFRALAIRCVACLFRLEGILQYSSSHNGGNGSDEYLSRTPEVIRTAKEGISVYAPLAQRMGLPKLKARIEDAAFRILYRRQYKAVASLYFETGHMMKTVSNYLLSDITKTLHQDKSFMSQIEDLQITSRVKEPYSFWKKLLKNRTKLIAANNKGDLVASSADGSGSMGTLSVTNVQDVVAFRVVLRAKRFSDDEDDETTRARERILCYYVQSLLQLKWGGTRLKDYIQHPKRNGYQSLHHTSTIITSEGQFPFEVQVRSRDMHEAAEHGQASHWFYKLSGGKSSPTLLDPGMPLLLPSSKTIDSANSSSAVGEATLGVRAEVPYRDSTGSYLKALTTAKRLLKTNVHVFMAGGQETQGDGRLFSLPSNARVQDVVRVMKEEVPSLGDDDDASIATVWRNGRVADLNDTVVNGDVLLIATP